MFLFFFESAAEVETNRADALLIAYATKVFGET